MLFILRKIIYTAIVMVFCNVCIGQHHIGLTKSDLIMIKGNTFTEKDGTIMYESPKKIVSGKEMAGGLEIFYFDKNNLVRQSSRLVLLSEEELLNIVKANNQLFTKVNVGKNQGFFQWLDTKNSVNLKLETTPMDNVFMVQYTIVKE